MKAIRIFLLVLIIIGIAAICTQSIWVPKLVNQILVWQGVIAPGKMVTFSPAPVAATSSDVISPPKKFAIVNGKVTLSPVCPVERMPPDPQCAPKPYAINVQAFSAVGNKLIKTVQSDANGDFTVVLPFGDYKIQAVGLNPYPRCSEVAVSIKTGTTISANISCDTGIR